MPRLLERAEGTDDPLTASHVDPDERPDGLIDGLIVNGRDPYAERRRMQRELHDGRPDPETPVEPPRRGRPPNALRLGQTPLSQPATPTPAGPEWLAMSVADFEAITARITAPNPLADRACILLATHECLRIPLEGRKRENMRSALKSAARRHGIRVQIKTSAGCVAVRKVDTKASGS